jgi:hypothetical protein
MQGIERKGNDHTPQSKKSKRRSNQIDLESSEERDLPERPDPVEGQNPAEGERSRNLSDVFNQMGVDTAGPSNVGGSMIG